MIVYFMKKESYLKDILVFALLAIIIVIPIRTFIAQPFLVSGVSMDPTFKTHDYLIINEISYYFREPKREEVVVMRYPLDTNTFFIKRIIGLPLETVTVKNGEIIIINKDNPKGFKIDSKYVIDKHKSFESFSVTLGPTEYFVMGDNRKESSDSRFWGPLPKKDIIGTPIIRLFPFNKIEIKPGNIDSATTTQKN